MASEEERPRLTAAVTREGAWYVARCVEFDTVSQGGTVEHAGANLRDVAEAFLEEEPPAAFATVVGFEVRVRHD